MRLEFSSSTVRKDFDNLGHRADYRIIYSKISDVGKASKHWSLVEISLTDGNFATLGVSHSGGNSYLIDRVVFNEKK
jgi:hypothetical protein